MKVIVSRVDVSALPQRFDTGDEFIRFIKKNWPHSLIMWDYRQSRWDVKVFNDPDVQNAHYYEDTQLVVWNDGDEGLTAGFTMVESKDHHHPGKGEDNPRLLYEMLQADPRTKEQGFRVDLKPGPRGSEVRAVGEWVTFTAVAKPRGGYQVMVEPRTVKAPFVESAKDSPSAAELMLSTVTPEYVRKKFRLTARDPNAKMTKVEFSIPAGCDAAHLVPELLGLLQLLGNYGCSRSVSVREAFDLKDKEGRDFTIGFDGDGADKIVDLKVDGAEYKLPQEIVDKANGKEPAAQE